MSSNPPSTLRSRAAFCSCSAPSRSAPIGLAVSGIIDRAKSRQEVAAWTNEQAVPTVRLVRPERGPDRAGTGSCRAT